MGLPGINVIFSKIAAKAMQQGSVGVVSLVLKDEMVLSDDIKLFEVKDFTDIPKSLNAMNQMYISHCLLGTPKSIKVIVINKSSADYAKALKYLETLRFNVMAIPGLLKAEVDAIASWVKAKRSSKKRFLAVLPNSTVDSEAIINFVTDDILISDTTFSATQFSARIAGAIAGLPLTMSPTFFVFNEIDEVPHLTRDEVDEVVSKGGLALFHDGEKVKIARGITSLTTFTNDTPEEFSKIKLMRIYDKIAEDIQNTIEDVYLGKVQNSYQNKLLLVAAINAYLEKLELENILDVGKNYVGIDIERQKNYLKSRNVSVESLSEQELKEANTGSSVFLKMNVKALDAIEDVEIRIEI